jgi:inhibitor of cysteine peptidase
MATRLLTIGLATLLVFAAGLSFACGDDDDDEPAAPTSTAGPTGGTAPDEVQLTDADNGSTVQLANGGTLIVALPSNITTGFSWSVSESSSPQLELQGEPQYVPAGSTTPVVGAGGTEVFTFKAAGTGTATLTLEYRRPFEPGVPPEQTFSVTVEIR